MAMTPEQKRKEEERRKRVAEERKRSGGFLEREVTSTPKEKGLTKRRMIGEFEQATQKARREGTEAPQMIGGQMVYPGQQAIRESQQAQISQEKTLTEPQKIEPSLIQKQFEAEGGFQELEGRGERVAERVAGVGLIPAKVAGDIITSGLEKLTGKKYGRKTTAELADTDFGKLLGVTTAGVATAALGFAAVGASAAAVSSITAKLAISLGVSKGAIVGVGLLGVGTLTGLSTDTIIDKILDRKETNEIISAITTIGATSGAIEGTYMAGGYGKNPGKAIAELQQLNDNLLIAEHQIQQAVILDERVKQSGELINIMADLHEQRLDIVERTTLILQSIPEYNPVQIAEQIEIFKDIRDDKRQNLIDRGIIREDIL